MYTMNVWRTPDEDLQLVATQLALLLRCCLRLMEFAEGLSAALQAADDHRVSFLFGRLFPPQELEMRKSAGITMDSRGERECNKVRSRRQEDEEVMPACDHMDTQSYVSS